MINVMITFLILLALGVGIILLQIFLSRKENKWLGLILPIISFCFSLIALLNIQNTPSLIFTVVSVFLLYNISTIILLVIYFACRGKWRRKKALDKMQAQDLE